MRLVKFNAVWCPGCLVMKPIWKEIKDMYPNLNIIDYDYDLDEDETIKYNIGNKLPVVIMFDDNNNEIKRLVGEKTKKEIIEFLEV